MKKKRYEVTVRDTHSYCKEPCFACGYWDRANFDALSAWVCNRLLCNDCLEGGPEYIHRRLIEVGRVEEGDEVEIIMPEGAAETVMNSVKEAYLRDLKREEGRGRLKVELHMLDPHMPAQLRMQRCSAQRCFSCGAWGYPYSAGTRVAAFVEDRGWLCDQCLAGGVDYVMGRLAVKVAYHHACAEQAMEDQGSELTMPSAAEVDELREEARHRYKELEDIPF